MGPDWQYVSQHPKSATAEPQAASNETRARIRWIIEKLVSSFVQRACRHRTRRRGSAGRGRDRTCRLWTTGSECEARIRSLRGVEVAVAQSLRRYDVEAIVVPTRVASVKDCGYRTYDPARYTAEHIPAARFIGYPAGSHLWLDHDIELSAEVQRLLASIPLERGP